MFHLVSVGPKQMAHLARSVASLRIFGDDLQPEEVSRILGCAPTKAWPKGRVQVSKSGHEMIKKTGAWLLHASDAEPENLDGQVVELLAKLTSDTATWAELGRRFEVDLFCGWFMESSNEGVSVSPKTMFALAERGSGLSLDIYGPDNARESEPAQAQPTLQADDPASGGYAA